MRHSECFLDRALTLIAFDELLRSRRGGGRNLGVVMPPSKQSATAETQVRKISRIQVLDKRSYEADELRQTLKQLASTSGSAKYWNSQSID